MEYLELYITFFKLGLFNFGGGYALLPLLQREMVSKRHWATDDEIVDYFAVGQCTPGVIAVNVSTFIGYKRKGILGGIIATLGFVTPAFFIIFIIATLLTNFQDNKYVSHALAGIRVMVFFLVLYAIVNLFKKSIKDPLAFIIALIVGVLAITTPIPLYLFVIIAGCLGILYNVIKEIRKIKKNNIEENPKEDDIEVSDKEDIISDKPQKEKKYPFIIGLFVGLITGLFGIISFIFVRNQRYKKGVLALIPFWMIMMLCTSLTILKDNTIFFRLYFEFFKVGLLAFGGGLATIPFLKELGATTGWFSATDMANMIAISESTPGAMGVNMSTNVGYTVLQNLYGNYFLSFMGSIIATIGIVTPAIIVIVVISLFLNKFKDNKYVEYAFWGLRAASIGLIIAAAYSIFEVSILNVYLDDLDNMKNAITVSSKAFKGVSLKTFFPSVGNFFDRLINWKNLGIGLVFGILIFKLKKHPIFYIMIAALVGIIFQM